ncbi:MAG: class I SAM-dependent methyltransferase [Ruminococcaceae bacterium]|nr:class I SAM-dependent methyltransferase [Oscillospiraceae bacterium]
MSQILETIIKEKKLYLETQPELFSPKKIDKGTLAMLSHVEFGSEDKVLDLGCGYGVVGILAAKLIGETNVVMCDVDERAVDIAKKNAVANNVSHIAILQSDCLDNIEDRDFTLVLSNPPYHTDFSVAKRFIEDSFKRLKIGGKMLMVTKRLDWYKNKLTSVFGGAMVYQEDGYFVFIAEKRQPYMAKKSKRR